VGEQGHLYFHSPGFDGIASAVLASDFLETARGMAPLGLHPVDYDLRPGCTLPWPSTATSSGS